MVMVPARDSQGPWPGAVGGFEARGDAAEGALCYNGLRLGPMVMACRLCGREAR